MDRQVPAERDAEVLPEQLAGKLLARASELDAAHGAGAAVGDLRAAAAEAGISPLAFDAALAELQGAEKSRVADARRRRPQMLVLIAAIAALIAIGAIAVSRSGIPTRAPVQAPK